MVKNPEILYIAEFLATQKGNEHYVVSFEMDNYMYLSYTLCLSFRRKGYKENRVRIVRDLYGTLYVCEGWSSSGENIAKIESNWIGDALFLAQNILAQMEWIEK